MMTQSEKLWLIISLSIPSILAQISATVMFFIDASMVGHLGAKASAAIGLVETPQAGWWADWPQQRIWVSLCKWLISSVPTTSKQHEGCYANRWFAVLSGP